MDNWNEFIKLYNSFQYQGIEKCHGTIYHYTSPESLQGIFETNGISELPRKELHMIISM